MTYTEKMSQYLKLFGELEKVREQNNNSVSYEEYLLLEKMDEVWYSMSIDEINAVEEKIKNKFKEKDNEEQD